MEVRWREQGTEARLLKTEFVFYIGFWKLANILHDGKRKLRSKLSPKNRKWNETNQCKYSWPVVTNTQNYSKWV